MAGELPHAGGARARGACGTAGRSAAGARQRARGRVPTARRAGRLLENSFQIAVRSADKAMLQRLAANLGARADTQPVNVIANLDVAREGAGCRIACRGRSASATICDETRLADVLEREIVTLFAKARLHYAWLAAAAFARDSQGLVIAGSGSTETRCTARWPPTAGMYSTPAPSPCASTT